MLPTNIGKCRIKLSALGMGCWAIGGSGWWSDGRAMGWSQVEDETTTEPRP